MAKSTEPSSTVHPPYSEMMSNAILTLEDPTSSSRSAAAKFMGGESLPSGLDRSLSVQVKKLAESERLLKVKGSCKLTSLTGNPGLPEKEAPKEQRATRKTRRLSHVETPEALKKPTRKRKAMAPEVGGRNGGKMKRLSQVKTPEGFKNGDKKKTKKTTTTTPVKRKSSKRASSSKPAKKGRK